MMFGNSDMVHVYQALIALFILCLWFKILSSPAKLVQLALKDTVRLTSINFHPFVILGPWRL